MSIFRAHALRQTGMSVTAHVHSHVDLSPEPFLFFPLVAPHFLPFWPHFIQPTLMKGPDLLMAAGFECAQAAGGYG